MLISVLWEKGKCDWKKQEWLYSIILWNCNYVTICSVHMCIIWNKDQEQKKKKKKNLSNWEFFVWNWEKNIIVGPRKLQMY